MKNDLLKIIEHYGVIPQLKYFQSEVFELNEAIMQLEHYEEYANDQDYQTTLKKQKEHIAEEIADCYVMLEQFRFYYSITEQKICEIIKQKIKRQLERMKENECN